MTEEGGLVVTGRAKEMIIRAGENIYPAEIENIMIQIDQVRLYYSSEFLKFQQTNQEISGRSEGAEPPQERPSPFFVI